MVQAIFPIGIIAGAVIPDTPGWQPFVVEIRDSNGNDAVQVVGVLKKLDRVVKNSEIRVTRKEDKSTYRFRFTLEGLDVDPKLYIQRAVLTSLNRQDLAA